MKRITKVLFIFVTSILIAVTASGLGVSIVASAASDANQPTIVLMPSDGWTTSVVVRIDYPSDATYKKYCIINPDNTISQTYDYLGTFSINKSGNSTIRAYYKNSSNEISYIEKEVTKIDTDAPNRGTMLNTIKKTIDLTAEKPVTISVVARDSGVGSGIRRVYVDVHFYEFTLEGGADTYVLDIYHPDTNLLKMNSIGVVAEDNVGNRTSRVDCFNPASTYWKDIEDYVAKYRALDREDYSENGWNKVISTYNALSVALNATTPVSSEIVNAKKAVDSAIAGDFETTIKAQGEFFGVANMSAISVPKSALGNVKKGEKIDFFLRKTNKIDDELASITEELKTLSAYKNAGVFAFTFTAQDSSANAVTLTDDVEVTIGIPDKYEYGKVFYKDGDSWTLAEITDIKDGKISFKVDHTGEYYLVSDGIVEVERKGVVIAGRFYSAELFGIAGGIAGALLILAFVIPFFVLKGKSKKY